MARLQKVLIELSVNPVFITTEEDRSFNGRYHFRLLRSSITDNRSLRLAINQSDLLNSVSNQ